MNHASSSGFLLLFALAALSFSTCQRKADADASAEDAAAARSQKPEEIKGPPLPTIELQQDKIAKDIDAYRQRTRRLYNNSRFNELEALADEARMTKARFGNGVWEIYELYDCFECDEKEPESMWLLHDRIHQAWIAARPESITARVAYAGFLIDYAWHARGSGYANEVTKEGWRLFAERLAEAQKTLFAAQDLKSKCPMWWCCQMTVALGQGWSRPQLDELFGEAKMFEPQFWQYDVSHAYFLLPRWHGEPGDWEADAEKEIERPGGLGLEGYARVVNYLEEFYDNIFRETKASWPRTRDGFEEIRRKYPESRQILNAFAKLACLAGDRPQAQKLFEEIGGQPDSNIWGKKTFIRFRNWAYGDSAAPP
jgi:hypothetical protein